MKEPRQFLMCEPRYFFTEKGEIDHEINAWMKKGTPVNHKRAIRQWNNLRKTLRSFGCEISEIDPQPGLSDFVFTANYALVRNNLNLVAHFRHRTRQREEFFIRQWFLNQRAKGLFNQVAYAPHNLSFEGQGDALFFRGRIFAGYGFRTSLKSHSIIESVFERQVISLRLVHAKFYHLDTCFCPLNDKSVLYYPDAFHPMSKNILHGYVPDLVAVPEKDAFQFACNSVVIDGVVIMGARPSPWLRDALRERNCKVEVVPFDEFWKSGGSVRCVTLDLN